MWSKSTYPVIKSRRQKKPKRAQKLQCDWEKRQLGRADILGLSIIGLVVVLYVTIGLVWK